MRDPHLKKKKGRIKRLIKNKQKYVLVLFCISICFGDSKNFAQAPPPKAPPLSLPPTSYPHSPYPRTLWSCDLGQFL